MREWFRVEAAAKGKGGGEILVYGSIGKRWADEDAIGAKGFIQELNALALAGPGDIHIRINSPGGDVADGIAIYNALRALKDRVVCTVDSVAYSMASVIAIAGRETRMQDTGQFMVHKPIIAAWGNEREISSALKALKTAKSVLVKAYSAKTGKSDEEIEEAMDATSWMTAEEAKDFGFVDEVITGDSLAGIAACFDVSAWRDYYEGRTRIVPVDQANSEIPVTAVSVAGAEDGGDGAAGTGAETPKENRMKASEIRELCPGASAEFVLAQVEASEKNESHGAVDVLRAWNAEQAKVVAAAKAEAEAAKAAAVETPKSPEKPAGLAPIGGVASEGEAVTDPIAAWHDGIAALEKRGLDRQRATAELCRTNKPLHQAYVAAYNAAHGRNHLAG